MIKSRTSPSGMCILVFYKYLIINTTETERGTYELAETSKTREKNESLWRADET